MKMTQISGFAEGRLKKVLLGLFLLSPVVFISTCTYVSKERGRAFDSIHVNDTRDSVLKQLGTPSIYEKEEVPFVRYSSIPCSSPCEERLWFENSLTFGIEAWSIDIGADNRVVHKAHWMSP